MTSIIPENNISKSIILSACLFGSVYIFSNSVIRANKKWIKNEDVYCNKQISWLELVNSSILTFYILTFSGIMIIENTHEVFRKIW